MPFDCNGRFTKYFRSSFRFVVFMLFLCCFFFILLHFCFVFFLLFSVTILLNSSLALIHFVVVVRCYCLCIYWILRYSIQFMHSAKPFRIVSIPKFTHTHTYTRLTKRSQKICVCTCTCALVSANSRYK